MKQLHKSALLIGLISTLAVAAATAQPVLSFDEFGNSNYQPGQLLPDPTGGLNQNVLVFNLPFPGLPGDVLMHELSLTNVFLDVIRFDGNFHLIFYSDNTDGLDAPADTPAPPNPLLPNQTHILELGNEGNNFANYAPLPGQPGFDPSGVNYHFVSDGLIPEPATAALALTGLCWFGFRQKLRKNVR